MPTKSTTNQEFKNQCSANVVGQRSGVKGYADQYLLNRVFMKSISHRLIMGGEKP